MREMRQFAAQHNEKPRKDEERTGSKSGIRLLLSCLAVLALHCRFEIFGGGFPDSDLLNGLNKLYHTFSGLDFVDLFVLIAIYGMLWVVSKKDEEFDKASVILSLVLSVTLVVSISFKKFYSADFLFANSFQLLISALCILGFWVVLYGVLRCVYHLFLWKDNQGQNALGTLTFLEKHFFSIGFGLIFLGWLPWILMNYPGSGCPDSLFQLRQFLGESPWAAGHPPLSSCIIGGLFCLGRWIVDANFGFFLYCLLQTCVGAWVFAFSMKKLQNLGISVRWCMWGIAFFAFTPFWGTYAQWVEKDLLYAEIAVLQTVFMMEILVKRQCGKRDAILLALAGLGAVFLRNNGIHAILPALLLLAVWLRGLDRRRVVMVMVLTLVLYGGVTKGLFPVLGVQGVYKSESLSIPFQQTARYVCEHSDEVTEYEKKVIDTVFGYDNMFNYDPVISDPIKGSYKGADLREYFKIWFQMFFKHPGTYIAAFVNQAYGYLAPVSQNIEAWVQEEYYAYMEEIGLYHVFDVKLAYVLAQIWNLSMTLPLVKYLCTPGLYTWIVVVLAFLLIEQRRYSGLILLVPSFVNILVCLASPLATAIRYELPTVASVPLLIGWVYFTVPGKKQQGDYSNL